jgi:hypothetical protein
MDETRNLEVGTDVFVLLSVDRHGVTVFAVSTDEAALERSAQTLRSGKTNAQVHAAEFRG